MKKPLNWENKQELAQIVKSLQDQKISICTTDTVIGLLSTVSKESFDRLNKIKGRSEKPYLILISFQKEIFQFADIDNVTVEKLIKHCWPGPLTLIVKAKKSVPDFMKSKDNTIALRVPDHQGLQIIMKAVGPLFSTSANLANAPVPKTIDQIKPEILDKIDFIVSDRKQEITSIPSTILDCSDQNNIRVVRQGAYPIQELEKITKKKFIEK